MNTDKLNVPTLRLPYHDQRRQVSLAEIVRFEAVGNYTNVYFRDGSRLLVALTLKRLAERVPDNLFVRLHRRHVVNRSFVGDLSFQTSELFLQSGERITISRRLLPAVRRTLQPRKTTGKSSVSCQSIIPLA